jgi:signal transduction histidine kinase
LSKVLLADDDPAFLSAASRALVERGYHVEEAVDGLDALQKALQDPPDIAVLDLVMPRVAGSELVSFFRQNPYLASVPIILLSGVLLESGHLAASPDADIVLGKGPLDETVRLLVSSLERVGTGPATRGEVIAAGPLRERRQVVELLQVNRDLGLVLEGAGAAILELDPAGRIAYANGRAEEVLGVGRASLIGTDLVSVFPQRGRVRLEALLARLQEDTGPSSRDMTSIVDDRAIHTVLTSVWADGARRALVATLYEVAADPEAGARPLRLLRYLAHEMRSSLLMMEKHLRALEPAAPGARTRRRAGVRRGVTPAFLAGEAARLLRLIGDATTLHRTFRELRAIEMEPLDPVGVVKDSISGITALAVPRGITVSFAGPAVAPRVLGDRDRLLQALYNLLLNALNFSPRDGEVGVELRADDQAVSITVADTGRGIPPKKLREIMIHAHHPELFLPDKERRVGLGLSIGLQIARAHRGQLTAESEVGRGSRFTLTLPVWPGEGAPAPGQAAGRGAR